MKSKYELHYGVFGNGDTKYMVVAVDGKGCWIHVHEFRTETEARNWMKWA